MPAWPKGQSVLDAFPAGMAIKDVVALLSSVGFSSPPSWLRPFHVLSTGEQFRVGLARLLAHAPDLAVMDEYTSVVDRTVAQVGSAALAKAVRQRGLRFVAVTCHEDVEAWLNPDWVYRPAERRFARRSLCRRPRITLAVGLPDDQIHAPNEKMTLDMYFKGIRVLGRLWGELAVALAKP